MARRRSHDPVQRPLAEVRLHDIDRWDHETDACPAWRALSPELEVKREALLREIDEAFAGVTRGRGVSWNETMKIDAFWGRDPGVSKIADPGGRWDHFVDDPTWDPETGFGGWAFLDASGYRYYLPPAMVRCVRAGHDAGLLLQLDGREQDRRWSLLNEAQCRCVGHFLWFMAFASLETDDDLQSEQWTRAAEGYWSRYGEEAEPPAVPK